MSLVITFYFTSSMLNMFRILIHPSSGACDFSIVSPHWSCVLVSMFVGVSVWLGWGGICVAVVLQPATRIPPQPSHTKTPTHIETRAHDQCGDKIEESHAPDDGCINVWNMLSIEEVKENLITSDIKLVSYSSTIWDLIFPYTMHVNIKIALHNVVGQTCRWLNKNKPTHAACNLFSKT
jgi:hypothetical protein